MLWNVYIYFLGDLLDRGPYSIEIFFLFMKLKLANMNQIFLTRGNHEEYSTYERYGFSYEIINQFRKHTHESIFSKIDDLLNLIPSLIFLTFNSKIYQLCHGAIDVEKDYSLFLFLKKANMDVYKYEIIKDSEYPDDDPYSTDINGIMWGDFVQEYDKKKVFNQPIFVESGYELQVAKRGHLKIYNYNYETVKKYLESK